MQKFPYVTHTHLPRFSSSSSSKKSTAERQHSFHTARETVLQKCPKKKKTKRERKKKNITISGESHQIRRGGGESYPTSRQIIFIYLSGGGGEIVC